MPATTECVADRHDTLTAYSRGCRCPGAREAMRVYQANYRKNSYLHGPRLVDAIGTRRRLRALEALGWSLADLSRRAGYSGRSTFFRAVYMPEVNISTEQVVRKLYDELAMKPGPMTSGGIRARLYAKRQGWAPPMAWDEDDIDDPEAEPVWATGEKDESVDEVAVERFLRGEQIKLNHAERVQVVGRGMTVHGYNKTEMISLLRASGPTVSRLWEEYQALKEEA